MSTLSAGAAGTFAIGGDLSVARLGFGTMQLTGPGVWGEPDDPQAAVAVLRRAVELGVTFFDTADSYGPYVAEPLLHRALAPYADDVVIATKAGFTRQGPNEWTPVGRPAYLRQQTEMSLRILGVERIDLQQLHRVDPGVPIEDQVGELKAMQDEGKIRHIGLSEVNVDEVEAASKVARIASVQNLFNFSRDAADSRHLVGAAPRGECGSREHRTQRRRVRRAVADCLMPIPQPTDHAKSSGARMRTPRRWLSSTARNRTSASREASRERRAHARSASVSLSES